MAPTEDAPLDAETTRAVTFDVTGTLIDCPRLGELYAEVLARHGIEAEPAEVGRLFGVVWRELDCGVRLGRDRFSAHPGGPRGWWAQLLGRLCEHLGSGPPSPFAAAELYHRFAYPEAWEIYPEVPGVLAQLARRGLALAVVSNWDERLPALLERLGFGGRFSAVVCSSEVGFEKPHPRIFQEALERLGVTPQQALHVGDSVRLDVEGALGCGMAACHLARRGATESPPGAVTAADLTALLTALPPAV